VAGKDKGQVKGASKVKLGGMVEGYDPANTMPGHTVIQQEKSSSWGNRGESGIDGL